MLAKRIIPCLDIKDNRVVKGVNFIDLKDAGDPVQNAQVYQQEGADELVFLDITASCQERKTVVELVKKVSEVIRVPFTVGGGIKDAEGIREVLQAGADKVSLNSAAVEKPGLITEISGIFGSQCIVVAIDARRIEPALDQADKNQSGSDCSSAAKKWQVYTHGGKRATGIDAVDWAREVESLGAGEILLTSMDRDGTKKGFDVCLTKAVSEAVNIPVIASGGAGSIDHFCEVFEKTKAAAALAASIFHYREVTIKEIKSEMVKNGIEARI